MQEFTRKMPHPRSEPHVLCKPAQSKCTWTCHKSHLCRNLQGKCRTPEVSRTFCASLRGRNAHGHVTRAILEIYRENAGRWGYHLEWTPTVGTPQCGRAVLGTPAEVWQKRWKGWGKPAPKTEEARIRTVLIEVQHLMQQLSTLDHPVLLCL